MLIATARRLRGIAARCRSLPPRQCPPRAAPETGTGRFDLSPGRATAGSRPLGPPVIISARGPPVAGCAAIDEHGEPG